MPDLTLAVDVRCLDCGGEVLRAEVALGDIVAMPMTHTCTEAPGA